MTAVVTATTAAVSRPFRMTVPHKPEVWKEWLVPSPTDQVALQCCTALLAKPLSRDIRDDDHIFSYSFVDDPDELSYFSDPLEAWIEFQVSGNR